MTGVTSGTEAGKAAVSGTNAVDDGLVADRPVRVAARETPVSAAMCAIGRVRQRSTGLRRPPMSKGAFACVTGEPRCFGRP
ncbi:hypothetical protein SUDANB6_01333 [Streptomyces sp. enrichment culture]